jgi:UDP-N-acetylenolpyruvoylglucosamine reductase
VLKSMLEKNVAFDQPMERWTTFRVGGKADALCFVENLVTLGESLPMQRKKEPLILSWEGVATSSSRIKA